MGWIAVFRVPPPQRAAANRLHAYDVPPALLDEEAAANQAGAAIPTQPTTPTIPTEIRRI
jgi:hypothetical protein